MRGPDPQRETTLQRALRRPGLCGQRERMASGQRHDRGAQLRQLGDCGADGCQGDDGINVEHLGRTPPKVLSADAWRAMSCSLPPPTDDDVSIANDGRRLDTKAKVLDFLAELEAKREMERASRVVGEGLDA